jgi:chromosome segregation protein
VLVEHLFPGGRGRLRLVDDSRGPRPVLGGASADAGSDAADAKAEAEARDEEDEGDEFASQGVEIEVTPAGKATRKLSLLSGGEKALVALAFVFSVFLARPSPFYILDEVEAALDDANIDRFLQLVSRFSDRAQFIIVTHQKRTMDAAEVLYGVSMGRGGITKVASRRFERDDAQPVLGEAAEAA